MTLSNQTWQRYGDARQMNGDDLAQRLVKLDVYPDVKSAMSVLYNTPVGDSIKTGVSAWTRIA